MRVCVRVILPLRILLCLKKLPFSFSHRSYLSSSHLVVVIVVAHSAAGVGLFSLKVVMKVMRACTPSMGMAL